MNITKPQPNRRCDDGFTLIELLVVMIILGVLASIAVPIFLSQQRKARDTAVRADVLAASKDVMLAMSEQSGNVQGDQGAGQILVGVKAIDLELSPDTELVVANGNQGQWCLAARNKTDGDRGRIFRYTALDGLQAVPKTERATPCS